MRLKYAENFFPNYYPDSEEGNEIVGVSEGGARKGRRERGRRGGKEG